MPYDWIKDVLTDLRDFARTNGMADLAQHLDGALDIARDEIARSDADRDGAGEGAALPGREKA